MSTAVFLHEIARLPAPGDNAAIATRRIHHGTTIVTGQGELTISGTVLEGHRFAVQPVKAGESLLSWGLPFGLVLRDIAPGEYLCNEKGLVELRHRRLDFSLPAQPNFKDHRIDFTLDESAFRPAEQIAPVPDPLTFDGYARDGGRGSGTRNFVVVMGTSSRTASIARLLADRFRDVARLHPNIDGVVAVAHTEGGGVTKPNNLEFTLRTLAGFMVHSNVAAVLALDVGNEPVNNAVLRDFMIGHGYPLDAVPHHFLSVCDGLAVALREGGAILEKFFPEAAACVRTPQPMTYLRLGLQCGGSDAFSGVSANPLLGCIARDVIRHGGSANLAETSELIGAEPYVLARVRDLETALKFLRQRDRFQEWAGWHGHSAEGNPSGGNLYRGLYNIVVKSIGAALKKHPLTRLDYCIDFGVRMTVPGYYFMDSPGNDLESIAGQVGAGCNLILFTTGNGSITNFPFVPTIKIVTTTGRYELLRSEMDFNAGRYLDGTPMEDLAVEAFAQTLGVASGERSIGEKAGHSQVQLWRDWAQTDGSKLTAIEHRPKPAGEPLSPDPARLEQLTLHFNTMPSASRDRVGLIVPTSLCASQIAGMIAGRLNATRSDTSACQIEEFEVSRVTPCAPVKCQSESGRGESVPPTSSDSIPPVTRYVALPHTEGCGNSRGESEELYMRTMTGYLRHPSVARALLLEHGCEKTHNDEMRAFMAGHGIEASPLGFASIQMDGGIDAVTRKVMRWFQSGPLSGTIPASDRIAANASPVRLALAFEGDVTPQIAEAFAGVAATALSLGGTVVMPCSPAAETVCELLGLPGNLPPTLAYGQFAGRPGLHLMETPAAHLVETLTGLGATGAEVIIALVNNSLAQSHPLVPVLQVSVVAATEADIAATVDATASTLAVSIWERIGQTLAGTYRPNSQAAGNTDFQISRGLVGVSL